MVVVVLALQGVELVLLQADLVEQSVDGSFVFDFKSLVQFS